MMKNFFRIIIFFVFYICWADVSAQLTNAGGDINISYSSPEEFEIGEVTISGSEFLDSKALISITNLKAGDKITIPGEQISSAMKKLWDQGLIGDIEVSAKKGEGKIVNIDFKIKERPRLSKFVFKGIKKADQEDLSEKIDIARGRIVNDALIKNARKKVKTFYEEKGFFNTEVTITSEKDSLLSNNVILNVKIDKNERVKISNIAFEGNSDISEKKLKRKMKKTKEKDWYKLFTTSKLIKKEYENDKNSLIEYYNTLGYRDASIVSDTVIPVDKKHVKLEIKLEEGRKYYFRNITWTGNYVYTDKTLDAILNIKKGEIYNTQNLQKRLTYNPQGYDVSSLYLDDGYLFFNVEPVEVLVEGDSIDIEMRVFEGAQATIKNVYVSGNTKTHDHVIYREIRTLPGQKFSRADLIRSQRELVSLGYFDQEQLGVNPVPNPQDGTVDINYTVVEKPSDQIELSGGWGGYFGFVGTLGLSFNNFSARNITKPRTWSPLPSGDGQRLSIRFQANGKSFSTYSLSFTEPWLGGKKPQSLTTSLTYSKQNNNVYFSGGGSLSVIGGTVTLGKRVKWPDDYFTLSHSLSYMRYTLDNYSFGSSLGFTTGTANNLTFNNTLSRNSLDDFTFPTSGSNISLSVSATPPYSLFRKVDYNDPKLNSEIRYKFVEFHKWMFDNSWFTTLVPGKKRNLVLNVRSHFGFIGAYQRKTGIAPFERFVMGGSGLSGFNFLLGLDLIGLRGYEDRSIVPVENGRQVNGVIFDKLVTEIRYPVAISPAFSLFILTFLEGGNNWSNFKEFNPFNIYRAVGVGTRIFMPAFGMIGIDYGYGLDKLPGAEKTGSKITFTIGQQLR
ncbi:MAG TPA: outer membrane protein assembly factor BamA [Cytophagaceae bacterium]